MAFIRIIIPMAIPIKVHNEVIGLLTVMRKDSRGFERSEQTLLEAVGDYASISMVNAQLFRALAQTAESAQAGEQRKFDRLENLRREILTQVQTAVYPLELIATEKMGALSEEQKQALKVIQTSLNKVNATKYYGDLVNTYNKVPFVQKVNPNLDDYATDRAIEGLFIMIAKEEKNIRQDPLARTTELLKKVFGAQK